MRIFVRWLGNRRHGRNAWHARGRWQAAGAYLAGAVPHRDAGGIKSPVPANPRARCYAFAESLSPVRWPRAVGRQPGRGRCVPLAARHSWPRHAVCRRDHEVVAHVLLPISTFVETSGTYVNLEGLWQSLPAREAAGRGAAGLEGPARAGTHLGRGFRLSIVRRGTRRIARALRRYRQAPYEGTHEAKSGGCARDRRAHVCGGCCASSRPVPAAHARGQVAPVVYGGGQGA